MHKTCFLQIACTAPWPLLYFCTTMKLRYVTIALVVLAACGQKETPYAGFEQYMTDQHLVLDSLPDSLAMVIEDYEATNPSEQTPQRLFVAASLHSKGNRLRESVAALEKIATDYTESSYAPDALISAGVNYENLQMMDHAKKAYSRFLAKYPNHKMHAQVQQMMDMLVKEPKTAEEQLDDLLKNKKE